jgi:uncharacterized integral membrane protein (TIGR00698 family)
VGICGASAALAVSSVLPSTRANERFTLLTVVGVTLMSTLAMVLYPLLAGLLGLSAAKAGIFFGATIHDVAQVVAAGMMIPGAGNTAAADSATVVKLFRVMLLMPVVLLLSLTLRTPNKGRVDSEPGDQPAPALLPGFLLAFIVFMLLATFSLVPTALAQSASGASRALLVLAIAAAGVKTSFEDLLKLGWTPVLMLLAESVWIAAFAASGLLLMA